jgi:hypothetical protein
MLAIPRTTGINFATAINFLCGAWLIASPWLLGAAAHDAGAWGSVLGGIAIAFVAILRAAAGPRWATLSWCNALLGASMIGSPWIFGYVEDPVRAWNSAVVGILVVILACVAETAPEAWTAEDDAYHPAAGWDYTYSVPGDKADEPAVWYASTNYGQAGLGDPERPEDAWSWRRWLSGAPSSRHRR